MKLHTENGVPFNLAPTALAIAQALPGEWTIKPVSTESKNSNFYLIRADGLTLWMADSNGGWAKKGRYAIHGSRPKKGNNQYVELYEGGSRIKEPEITVSDEKHSTQIAKDIVSRLLPEAERVHTLAMQQIKGEQDYAAKETATREAMQATVGGRGWRSPDGAAIKAGYGDWKVSGETVSFDLNSMPLDKAKELAAFLTKSIFPAIYK
jgi:hypothetical protein